MGRRDRGAQRRFELYTKGGNFGPEQKGWILFREGEKLVHEGKAVRIVENDELLCYQLTGSAVKSQAAKPTLDSSESVLTNAEVDAIVGEHMPGGDNIDGVDGGPAGRSHTAGLSEKKRRIREALGLEAVDFVEASRIKLNAFDPRFGRSIIERDVREVACL